MTLRKFIFIIIGLYMLATFTIPTELPVSLWQASTHAALYSFLFHYGQYIAMFTVFVIALLSSNRPKDFRWLNKVTQPKVLAILTCIVVIACTVLTHTHTMGVWWTWQTVGMHFASVVLIVLLLKDRLPSGTAFMLGCGFIMITAGVWEIIYKCGLWNYYYCKSADANWLLREVRFMVPFALLGLATTLVVWTKNKSTLHFNTPTLVFTLLTVSTIVYWFLSGFWCSHLYDRATHAWYLKEPEPLGWYLTRWSKAFLNLTLVSLCLPEVGK